jgi:sterol desaturase/sphingolipid hydroxylase (fatty acid hydroxylase superfamily)
LTHHSFWYYWLALFGVILGRYFLVAGGTYLLFYSAAPQVIEQVVKQDEPPLAPQLESHRGPQLRGRRLRLKPPQAESIVRDIELAMFSTLFFATAAAFIIWSYDQGATRLYADLSQYGYGYAVASFGIVLILQDAYFYFIHRAFHQPFLFKYLHAGHHRSGDPTPWTSFAFDPAEAALQAAFLVGITFAMPLNFVVLIALLLTMTVWTVINHLGFELFPAAFSRHWLSKWLIGSTHHSLHHRKYRVHYGLYFTFWDKLLGTADPLYEQEFDAGLREQPRKLLEATPSQLACKLD